MEQHNYVWDKASHIFILGDFNAKLPNTDDRVGKYYPQQLSHNGIILPDVLKKLDLYCINARKRGDLIFIDQS